MLSFGRYHTPSTLEEALGLLAEAPEGSRVVAGATDILPWAREGRAGDVEFPESVDIGKVAELSGHEIGGGRVRLGANVTMQDFLEDRELGEHLPCMPYCSVWFADDQIRRQATLVGNIVNASPAADGTPPMLAMNGEIEVARLQDDAVVRRTMALGEFVLGPGRVDLARDEVVTAVTCDSLKGYGGSFQKVGQRRSLVISKVCAVACIRMDASTGVVEDVRLALGGIGPVPVRLDDIEEMMRGEELSEELVREACESPPGRVASRTRREYRRHVVRGFVEAAIGEAAHNCGASLARGKEMAHA